MAELIKSMSENDKMRIHLQIDEKPLGIIDERTISEKHLMKKLIK